MFFEPRVGFADESRMEGFGNTMAEEKRHKIWEQGVFTADMCESLVRMHEAAYGDFASTMRGLLEEMLTRDLSDEQRTGTIHMIHALTRADLVFRRRQQHLNWHIPFHLARIVDEIVKILLASSVGDVHVFPFEAQNPSLIVIHHVAAQSFNAGIINVNPMSTTYLPHNAERPPKVLMQTVLEVKNIPKTRICSEAFWATDMLSDGADDITTFTHIIPWLNQKTHDENVKGSAPAFATGTKCPNGNLWKAFIHAYKYVLRRAKTPEPEVKMMRVLIKQKMLTIVQSDLGEVEEVTHSTRLIIEAALHNVSLSLTRNVKCLPPEEFEATKNMIDEIDARVKKLPCPDKATTAPPPALNITEGWDKVQRPDLVPGADNLRRIEDVEHFIGTAVEQPRYVPVNFLRVTDKVESFDDALRVLDETLTLCTRITNQLNVVKSGGFLITSLISQLFLEVLPAPLGPKSRAAGKKCIWDAEIRYGQQMHVMKRLWNACEFFTWASFSCKTGKEFDSQRIITLGCIATISDAVIRLLATDFPSVISQHLRGYRRKAPFVVTVGKLATQTESSVVVFPQILERRCSILDYHNELCEDVPVSNVMWQWEDSMQFCKATQLFLRQVCLVEGLPTNSIMSYFGNEVQGHKAALQRYWPEYTYHRDMYLLFKWMMAPKPRLPNCQSCMECITGTPEVNMDFSNRRIIVRYMHRELMAKATALRFLSFAIPSKFTAPFDAGTEDDILHIKNLPTFDDVMGQRDSELLLSYLTTPYIRIPLVLSFFATEDRVSCLGHNQLRQLLEAVLFEPAKFLPRELNDSVPAQVPAEDPAMLATTMGLLMNELIFSPEGVIEPLMRLVRLAREMDAGTVHNHSVVEIILYLVRITARVQSYVAFALELCDGTKEQRGFKAPEPEAIDRLRAAHVELNETVFSGFLPMIEAWNTELMSGMQKWAESARDIDKATRTSANLHAHVLLLLRNLPLEGFTTDKVSMLMASIMFLTARHTFNEDALGVPETEIFDIMQKHRRNIVRWMHQQSPANVGFIMDSAVRIATTTGTRTEGPGYDWGFVAGEDCIGRFTRVDAETLKRPNYNSRRGDLELSLYQAFGNTVGLRPGFECINEGIQDVEINLHILSLTFKASHLVALPSEIAGHRDVHEIFASSVGGNDALLRSMQCAIVQDAENRQWVRLVGQEHDIQYWSTPDPRVALPDDAMRFFPDDLSPAEEWIYNVVEPLRRAFFLRSYWLPPIFLLLPEHKLTSDQSVVTISAVCSKTGRKLKEIVAYRDYETAHVYDVFSLGRRWYRRLVYTTNTHFSKCELQPETHDRRHMWKQWQRHAAGDFEADETEEQDDSVVILRHASHPENLSRAVETFLPNRILEGLIPEALLETHRFWQDPDDNIRGYPQDKHAMHVLWAHWRDVEYEPFGGASKHTCLRLIRFSRAKTAPKVSEQAVLKSQKLHVTDEADEELERMRTHSTGDFLDEEETAELDEGMFRQSSQSYTPKAESATIEDHNLMLVELMHARKGTPLHSLAQVFARIELLSHVLCWTTKVDYDGEGELTLDLIQLPRLKLTFSARVDADGKLQLFSLDHAHLFISNLRPKMALNLLQGIPHSLLLADVNEAISILVPALDVARPSITTSPFSTELVINRANRKWYKKLDTRYYLYPVHVSMSFVFTPTLASSLYLLSLRFFHCEYEEVFKIASTIGTDVEFTDEERQNFDMLDSVHDWRPEAHACRAKIGLLVADSPVNMCWDLPKETAAMLRSSASIGMSCRLSESEERRLLYICQMLLKKMEIINEVMKRAKEDTIDTVHSRLTDRMPIFEGAPSERKQIKQIWSQVGLKFREQLNIRANKDDISRMVLLWCKFRRWDDFPGFYQCIIDNRMSFLEAEAKAIETGSPQKATYTVPKMGTDEFWNFYKDFDVISIKVPEAQGKHKNDDGRSVEMSSDFDYFYCGADVRKGGMCKCKDCDENCGPTQGCPCSSCERWNKANLHKMRFVPPVPSYSARMLSFYDAFNWIESVLEQDQSARQQKEHVAPEIRSWSTRIRPSSLREDQNSFLRYYECMTGTTRVRIGSGDSAKDIVHLMFPLCAEARRPESALGHLMHYLLNNQQVWSKLPKYNRSSKQSHEQRMAAIYSAIMVQASTVCKFPGDAPITELRDHTVTVEVTPRPTTRRDPIVPILATRILPNLSNTDNTKRVWATTDLKHLEIKSKEDVELSDATRDELRGQLLKAVIPEGFMGFFSRAETKAPLVEKGLAFDLRKHDAAATSVAQSMIQRLEKDMSDFAEGENNARAPRLVGMATAHEVKAMLHDKPGLSVMRKTLAELNDKLTKMREGDQKFFTTAFAVIERTANAMPLNKGSKLAASLMHLRRQARQEAELGLAYLIACLTSTAAETDWQQLNPFLTAETCDAIVSLLTSALLRANRIGHINRASEAIKELSALLSKGEDSHDHMDDAARANMYEALAASTQQKADSLAGVLATKRVYIDDDFSYDPRFLIFEYNWNLVLRSRQRQLIKEIHSSIIDGTSIVKQMIMGAGKTTVVGPLLALMLADSKNLVIQVVPPALLDFTRSILRATFSSTIQKQIFCFICDRATEVDSEVLSKFQHARQSRGIVVTTPSTIKSIFLKYVEGLDRIEDVTRPPIPDLDKEVNDLGQVLDLWRDAVLIMDEVDMLLHPLKSELNFPIGAKHDIDFAPARWKLPMHLIDALFYFHTKRISVGVKESNESREVLRSIAATLKEGLRTNALQSTPHLTLLNLEYYDQHMKIPFARWLMLFLKAHHFSGLSDEQTLEYITKRPSMKVNPDLNAAVEALEVDHIKTLNLAYEWINAFLPHVMQKIDRVSFGIMSPDDMRRAREEHPNMPRSRFVTSIPFIGKDLPSSSSEFAHPDVVIGLTILAYRYEGLRPSDYTEIMRQVHAAVEKEVGRFNQRRTNVMYNRWVQSAGGRLLQSFKYEEKKKNEDDDEMGMQPSESVVFDEETGQRLDVLPLKLMKQANKEESDKLMKLFKRTPEVIHWYLCETVFPEYMRHQLSKLSASGQELGGNIMFRRRIGFSGTPSDLLPRELGTCEYEPGTDGKLVHTLTNPEIMSTTVVEPGWTVRGILDHICQAHPPYHALIDTGALITGMSNQQVAQYLLKHGLNQFEGVVFLDEFDRKMILVRATGRVLKLAECGIPKVKRFAFYDQVHTTGMDIQHTPNAMAVVTLGKDMVFRDFAQGAYRMRGIGQGQKVDLLVIPEVHDLINRTLQGLRAKPNLIVDVTAWLLVNSIRSEHTQHNQLCLQTIGNVWRKEAYERLVGAVNRGEFVKGAKQLDSTVEALNVFREPVDYAVPKDVPQPRMFSETIATIVGEHQKFISTEGGKTVVAEITEQKQREDEVDNPVIDVQMVQEQEEEREQESEKEKEQEIEMEKFVDLAYSRDDENAVPWAVSSLKDFVRAQQFYKLSDFHLYKRRPLEFPDSIMLSRNFFNPKWAGHRRIKNVIVSMEWTPSMAAVQLADSPQRDYGAVENERAMAGLSRTMTLLKNHQGTLDDALLKDFIRIALGNPTGIADAEWAEAVALIKDGSPAAMMQLLSSNLLRHEDKDRFTVALALGEAETLRRIIHTRRVTKKPLVDSADTEISLRMVPAGNVLLDHTPGFKEAKSEFMRYRNFQNLRFFDSDLHYSDQDLNVVLRSLHVSAEKVRQAYFLQLIACRRRARQRWERCPIALVFDLKDPFTLLHQKTLGLCMRRDLERRELHLADAFIAMNASHSGQLSPDEIWGALRFCRMDNVTAEEVLDFIQVADTHHEGTIQYPDFLALLTGSNELEDDDEEAPGKGGDAAKKRNLPTVDPFGGEELRALRADREKMRRREEEQASKAMATEDKRIREEIEQEQMKEELALIQTCQNPSLGDKHLLYTLEQKEVPKLANFFGPGKAAELDEDNKQTYFALNGDGGMKLVTRAVKLLRDSPTLTKYSVSCEFQVPTPATATGKLSKKSVLTLMDDEGVELNIMQFATNTYTYSPSKLDSDNESSTDYDSDDDDTYTDDDDDDDGRVTYVFKRPEVDKKLRVAKVTTGDAVVEQVGERLSTTTGKQNVEWMKVCRPVKGWVPFEEGGIKQWDRVSVSISLRPNGTLSIDDAGAVNEEALVPTVFQEEKKKEEEDDDDGWWKNAMWSFFGDDEGGDDDDDDDDEQGNNVDMGDLTDLVHALKKAKELKPGDKVTRNPECWEKANEDGGEGTVGKIVKVDENKVTAQWPNGHKGQYAWGEAGKFELIKVGSADENDDDLGREVSNDERWSKLLRNKAKIKCRACSTVIQTEQGWFKCNQCPTVYLCKKCFKAMEHDEHEFTDMEALSELLKTSTIVIGSMVRINPDIKEPKHGWGEAPRDGTPGLVVEMDDDTNLVSVQFVDLQWEGHMDDLVVVDPKFESYQGTWLGAMLNTVMVEKARHPATCAAIDQGLIPPVIEGKYKIGQKIKARWRGGRCYPGEIRAVLPDSKYAVAFDDGDFEPQQREDQIWLNPFNAGVRVRVKRGKAIDSLTWTPPAGVTATTAGDVKTISYFSGVDMKVRVQFRLGTRVVYANFRDSELEIVGKGRWLMVKGDPEKIDEELAAQRATLEAAREAKKKAKAEAAASAPSAAAPDDDDEDSDDNDDAKSDGGKSDDSDAEAFRALEVPKNALPMPNSANIIIERGFMEGTTDVELFIRDGTYKASFEGMTLTNPKSGEAVGKLFRDPPEPWVKQQAAMKLDDGKWHMLTLLVDGDDVTALCDGREMPLDLALTHFSRDELDAMSDSDAESDSDDDDGIAPPNESDEGYTERKKIDIIYDSVLKELLDTKPDAPFDTLIATLEKMAKDGVKEAVYETASSDEDEEEATDEEESEDADDEDGESSDSDEKPKKKMVTASKSAVPSKEKPSLPISAAAAAADDDDDTNDIPEDDPAEYEDSSYSGSDSSETTDSDSGSESDSDDSDGGRIKNLKELRRTAGEVLALDVRSGITVFPLASDEVNRYRSKYGPNFPIRRVAKVELAWDDEGTSERAKSTFEAIDKATTWRCPECHTDSSRLLDACTECKRERYWSAKDEEKKTKVRSVLPRSKEANELRRKLHAKLRSQYQKQLEQYDDLATLL